MDLFSRREFLNRSALLAAASAVLAREGIARPAPTAAAAATREDKLRVAVVGVRGRGLNHVNGFLGKNNCEITVVCDCDEAVIGPAMRTVEAKQGRPPAFVKDIRKVVEDRNVDIVAIATPNHWHALMAVWAMQNGKDVYVEKPASHNVREGAIMLAAARKYKRICQVGTQSRSNPGMRQAIDFVRSGKIGTVELAIGLCYKPRGSIGKVSGPTPPPPSIDYDLWCGPAPNKPVMRKSLHYDWHWIWDYGNGDLGNQGVHEMDKARWGLGLNTLPRSVFSLGGRFGYVDDGETANTQLCYYDFGPQKLVFEVRGLTTEPYKGAKVGNIWIGSEGSVVCPNYGGGVAYDRNGKEIARFSGGSDQYHFDNFVKAVRSRRHEDLNCDIAEGHLSAALCHLGNISLRLGTEAPLAKADGASPDPVVREFAARMLEHLKANKVDVEKTLARFGPVLTVDPATETLKAPDSALTERANTLLFREYRKGFELKEAV